MIRFAKIAMLICIACIASQDTSAVTEAERNTYSQLNSKLKNILETESLVGLAWSTISEGKINSSGLGMANIGQDISMTASTPIQVGSVTKTLIAIGVLRLTQTSDLSLDSEVAQLLPDLPIDNPWGARSPVLVRHLLEHTAGLNNLYLWQFLNTKPSADTPLRHSLTNRGQSILKVRSKPGTQYSYSNIGYTLLGALVERVANQRYEDYLETELLTPLSMNQSTFHFRHQHQETEQQLAMGYLENNQEIFAQATYLRPAGQFTTTAQDMTKFADFLLGEGKLNGQQIIPADLMQQLAETSTTDAAKTGLRIGHGLALALRDRHGVLAQCHPGTTFGFRANLCVFPKQGKAFFYAVNTDNETANYEALTKTFIHALRVVGPATIQTELPAAQSKNQDIEGFYVPSPNNMEEFEWLDKVFNFQYLYWQDGQLVLWSLQKPSRLLAPISDTLFRATDRRLPSHTLFETEGGFKFSNGLHTYEKASALSIVLYLISLILGLVGLLYIFVVSAVRLFQKQPKNQNYLKWPFFSLLLFALPAFAFQQQHFMQFGELTLASGLLYLTSTLLPISLITSILATIKLNSQTRSSVTDLISMASLLQLCLVLFFWGMLPIKFWAAN